MSWCALDVRAPAGSRLQVASWLVGRTGQAVEEREDGVLTGFAESETAAALVHRALVQQFGAGVAVETRALPEVNWGEQWREGLAPRRIGRLTITPSWAVPEGSRARTVIIDPETAFGSGEHGSTRTALVLLDRYLRSSDRVLDLGSGSGILAIAAAKLGAARAIGVELEPDNEAVAVANARQNGVEDRVRFLTGNAAHLGPLLAPADLVLSNILRSVNVTLLDMIAAALAPEGIAICAGMEQTERELFLPALEAVGLHPIDEAVDAAWWGVAARRE